MACVRKQRGGPCHRLYTSSTQTSNSRLAMSPPILYLVTTKSSAMVWSCCSSSDIVAPGFRNVSLAIRWADSRNQSRYYQAARRPSSSAHGLHAQRSHAYYAVASQVSSHTMAPKPTEAFGCFPKKGTIVKFTTHLTVLKISDSIELWCFPISQYTFSNSKPALSLLKSTTIIPSITHWKK